MVRTRLAPAALADIRAVLRFTHQRYGAAKAQEYRDLIGDARRALAQHPRLGLLRPDIDPNARIYPIAQSGRGARHVFLYELIKEQQMVYIVAFLYDAMDFAAQWRARKI